MNEANQANEILTRLAKEALAVQDACNLSGVVHGFARAMTQLREALPEAGTDALNKHHIAVLWADKIAHLTGTQNDIEPIHKAYQWAYDFSGANAECEHGCGCKAHPDMSCERAINIATEAAAFEPYYTVVIPWSDKPTQWHPTERTGPLSTLTRGAFKTPEEAHGWAKRELDGQPYEVRRIEGDEGGVGWSPDMYVPNK